jgi:thiosulfate reductase cytochrome b subunit
MLASSIKSINRQARRKGQQLHPLPIRIMRWINAVAIFIMIGSGWKIYNDDVIFGWLHFPDFLVIGKWAQYGLQWHFFGMWIFALNGLAYFSSASPADASGANCFRFRCEKYGRPSAKRCGFGSCTTIWRTTAPFRRSSISASS